MEDEKIEQQPLTEQEQATPPEAEQTPEEEAKPKKKKAEKVSKLQEELEAARAEVEQTKDRLLRMAAEYENFRRRTREEKETCYGGAMADTVSAFLPIIDNLERASGYADGEKVREGLVMIASSVSSVLAKLGVEEFGKPGDKFDPNLHNAVMHEDDDSGRENEITDVFQKGYKKGNRVIRFAMVKTVN